jgi:hypothetical protein
MAAGDAAVAAGMAKLTGTIDLVKNGDDEINITRDYIAAVMATIPGIWPVAKGGTGASTVSGARTALGITGAISVGSLAPSGGSPGDVYLKYVP